MFGQTESQAAPTSDDLPRAPTPVSGLDAMVGFTEGAMPQPDAASMARNPSDPAMAFRFREYSLAPGARVLLRSGEPVPVGDRAFDLLCVLLAARGQVVERTELMRRVWPTTVVEESNLRFQIACARRALGDDRDLIKSVAGRGYFFISEPEQAPPGWRHNPFEAERDLPLRERSAPALAANSSLPADPTGAQSPEDYRASCELLRELLNSVLQELRELRGCGPTQSPTLANGHRPHAD